MWRGDVDEPVLLQTGPETFQVLLGGGRRLEAILRHEARRGLGAQGVAPVVVATEIVRFLIERDALPVEATAPVELAAAGGRFPGFVDELRSRLS